MRREGRIHGNNVRLNKKESGAGQRVSNKPTNHSKVSARCPGNGVKCVGCSSGLPVKKSMGKVKTALKARDLDVTKNHKMHEWSFSQKHRWGDYGCGEETDNERERGGPSGESDQTEEYWADDQPSPSPVLECPIELLVQMRKPKAVRPLVSPPEAMIITPTVTPESAESNDSEYESVIDDESWSDFDFSDGEEVSYAEEAAADDWVFVTEMVV
ncbi:unnamed protein product [Calypogeia fissa]